MIDQWLKNGERYNDGNKDEIMRLTTKNATMARDSVKEDGLLYGNIGKLIENIRLSASTKR